MSDAQPQPQRRRRLCPICSQSMHGVGEMAPDARGDRAVIWQCDTCKMAAPLRRYRHLVRTVYAYRLRGEG